MIYFSTAPVSLPTVDETQYAALKEFRQWCESEGLIETSDNLVDFRSKLSRQLQITIRTNDYLKGILEGAEPPSNSDGRASGIASSDDPLEYLRLGLSEEAGVLLLEAALDGHGQIEMYETFGGRFIHTNGKTMGEPADRRSMARWEYALEQLVSAELVRSRGTKNEVFETTELGFQMADYLKDFATKARF